VHPPPIVTLSQSLPVANVRGHEVNVAADDQFVDDDVVVERPAPLLDQWLPEQLQVVVGLCGYSIAAESGFLRTNLPLAFDLDPNAPEAASFAHLVRDAHQVLLVHLDAPLNHAQLAAVRKRIGAFDGVASRVAGVDHALRGTKLLFFDENGERDRAQPMYGVGIVQRDVTVDNRSDPGYVRFMLGVAAGRSRRFGATVVLMRPTPNSLFALSAFANEHPSALIALR